MLKDLKILNGILDLEFNEYIDEYTITVSSDIKELELSYELTTGSLINIRGNNIVEGENVVYLDVYNNDFLKTYTLYVYKESVKNVSEIDEFISSLEVNTSKELPLYKIQLLSVSMFLIIIILFSIIFKRTKKTYKM